MKNILLVAAAALAFFGTGSISAAAADWEMAIERVQKASEAYFEYAKEAGGTSWAGTMYNGHEFDRHQCAIVGRMLGLESAVVELETMPYPPMDETSDPHDLLVFSISLGNWVGAAKGALEMNESQRRSVWNLDCVGSLGISTAHYIENQEPDAQFKVADGTLYVYGDIEPGFFERFKAELDSDVPITQVALGSGGGSVGDALLSGAEIRSRGLDTTIYGNCYSACPLVFMGGQKRILWATPNRLGFHQVSRNGTAVPYDDDIYVGLAEYLHIMGIDAKTVITWMLSKPPEGMHEPLVAELCDVGVATWVQRICGGN